MDKIYKLNKIIIKNNCITEAILCVNFCFDKKNNEVIARFAPSMITTAGKNLTHAKEMFQEAFTLWVATINEYRNAKEMLEILGWKVAKTEAMSKVKQTNLPDFPFLESKFFKLSIPDVKWAS
ncbi:MAG: hypothetical protein LBU55_01840 [Elusimicrobiota bacterium]|nr:hypothetical protein [Elusimicrobiota bacterium]